jgi:hypothetical protein
MEKIMCGICTPKRTIVFNESGWDHGNPYEKGKYYPYTIGKYYGVRYFDDESVWGVIYLSKEEFHEYFSIVRLS